MKRTGTFVLLLFAAASAYLLAWPVPVDPLAWDAPRNRGLVDPFAANVRLRTARPIDISPHSGPEDLAQGPDRSIYATTTEGKIIRFGPTGMNPQVYADPGGRPLGLEFDQHGTLFVANAMLGLQSISPDGAVELLVDAVDGQPLAYANDLAIADDGKVYFTDSSLKFGAATVGDTYEASFLDIVEHGGHGRLLVFDPEAGDTRVLMHGLNFANGVAISPDQQYLLVAETSAYRILKFWIEGPDAGTSEPLLENLPGFPDNINSGFRSRFWVGLIAPRNELLDRLSNAPRARKVIMRLPRALRPRAEPSSHVVGFDGTGQVLMNLQDTSARFPSLTGVLETRDALYLSTLFGNHVPRLDKRDLVRN